MRVMTFLIACSLSVAVFAGPSFPPDNDFQFATGNLNIGSRLTIELTENFVGFTGQVTVKNVTTRDTETVFLSNGTGSVNTQVGNASANGVLDCAASGNLVYVLYVNAGKTDGEVKAVGGVDRTFGDCTSTTSIYVEATPDNTTVGEPVSVFAVDYNTGQAAAPAVLVASAAGNADTEPLTIAQDVLFNNTGVYSTTVPTVLAGSASVDGTLQCTNPDICTFQFSSNSTGNPTCTATGHQIVPVELQSYDVD